MSEVCRTLPKRPEPGQARTQARKARLLFSTVLLILLFPGEALHVTGDVHPDIGLLPHDPGVVPRTYHIDVARACLLLGAVVHDDVHAPGDHVAGVLHLAAVGPADAL